MEQCGTHALVLPLPAVDQVSDFIYSLSTPFTHVILELILESI